VLHSVGQPIAVNGNNVVLLETKRVGCVCDTGCQRRRQNTNHHQKGQTLLEQCREFQRHIFLAFAMLDRVVCQATNGNNKTN
jgi:hypothetical protein